MVAAVVNQIQDSGLYDHKFLRDWEQKLEHEKTWETMKTHYTNEYNAIKNYGRLSAKSFESMNNIQKQSSQEITAFFDELCRDAIQQMSKAFTRDRQP